MFDLTRQGEDVVCRLLNVAFGWELVNLNRERPNCPAVDLADAKRRICVQVTASRKTGKAAEAAETAEMLEKHHGGKYDRLLLVYLLGKPGNLPEWTSGSCRIEAWDLEDLAAALDRASPEGQAAALAVLHELEDGGVLEKQPDLSAADEQFLPSREVMEAPDEGQALLVCQRQRIRLVAFLARSPGETMCCKIEFSRRDTGGSHITFDQRTLLDRLLKGHHEPLEKRPFAAAIDRKRDFAALQLGNCRYFTDVDTARQLCEVLDILWEEYEAGRKRLAALLGTDCFSVPPEEDWTQPLCRMPIWLWELLQRDARSHDACRGKGAWDLFDGCAPPDVIRILRGPEDPYPRGIAAELTGRIEGERCLVSWRRGRIPALADWKGFEDGTKWRADRTLTWMLTSWLPRLQEPVFRACCSGVRRVWPWHRAGVPSREAVLKQVTASIECFYPVNSAAP